MHGAHDFLLALTVVLGVAAVTTVLFQRLRQPVVLGYILAGLIVGPHVPIPLVADREIVQTLSELGVILLMFALGLEFSLRKLVSVGPTAGVTAVVQSSIMVWLGFVAGRAFGWTTLESVFAGAIVAISSTTIIAKAFDEQRVRGRLRDLVVGVLLVEDLFAILFMAVLTAVATGAGLSPGELGATLGRLGAFLAALLVVGHARRAARDPLRGEARLAGDAARREPRPLLRRRLLALAFGYSVALGAFIAGSLVAESGEGHEVEQPRAAGARPLRGHLLRLGRHAHRPRARRPPLGRDPRVHRARGRRQVPRRRARRVPHRPRRADLGAGRHEPRADRRVLLHHRGARDLARRDARLPLPGRGGGLGGDHAHDAVAHRRLGDARPRRSTASCPGALQTFVSLYGSWLEQLRASPDRGTLGARVRRIVRALLVDAAAITAVVIGARRRDRAGRALDRRASPGSPGRRRAWPSWVVAALLAAPFCVGLLRTARALGLSVAAAALPEAAAGRPDLAAAPRRVLVAAVQLGATVLVLLPVVALTQPFLPGVPGAVVLAAALVVLGVAFWRSAANLQGHVRAGAQVIVEALAKQGSAG